MCESHFRKVSVSVKTKRLHACDAALLQVSTRQKNKRVLIKRHMPMNANKYSADTVLGVVLTNSVDRKTSEQEKLRTIRFHLHNVPRQVRLIWSIRNPETGSSCRGWGDVGVTDEKVARGGGEPGGWYDSVSRSGDWLNEGVQCV